MGCPIVRLRTNLTQDRNLTFFINTGSPISLISSQLVQAESSRFNERRLQLGIDGSPDIHGMARVSVFLDSTIPLMNMKLDVVNPTSKLVEYMQNADIVLGFNVLNRYKAKLDFGTDQLILKIPPYRYLEN